MKRPPQIQFRLNSEARGALEQIREALALELGSISLNRAAKMLYDLGLRAVQDRLANGRNLQELLEFKITPAGQRQLLEQEEGD